MNNIPNRLDLLSSSSDRMRWTLAIFFSVALVVVNAAEEQRANAADDAPATLRIANTHYEISYQPVKTVLSIKTLENGTVWETHGLVARVMLDNKELPIETDQIEARSGKGMLTLRVPVKLPAQEPLIIHLAVKLEEDRVLFEVERVEHLVPEQAISIDYPCRLGMVAAGSKGYLVLPLGTGAICTYDASRTGSVPPDLIYSIPIHSYTMPFFGIVRDAEGCGAIVKTPFDCRLVTAINEEKLYGIWPRWEFELRHCDEPRQAQYVFEKNLDYNQVAKIYRRELIRNKNFVPFKEKIRDNPSAGRLPGALNFQMGLGFRADLDDKYKESSELGIINSRGIFQVAKNLGLDRMIVYNFKYWNYNPGSFWSPFQRGDLPPGEKTYLASSAAYARSLSDGYVASVYHNFIDVPITAPYFNAKDILLNRDGTMKPNFIVGDNVAFTVCPHKRLERARDMFPFLAGILGKGNIYIDVEGAASLEECFSRDHPCNRKQDAELRREVLATVRRQIGSVNTECVPDYMAGAVDMGLAGVLTDYMLKVKPALQPVPLYPLVYNDSVRLAMNMRGSTHAQHALYNGLPELWGWTEKYDLLNRISHQLRPVACQEMTRHQFLTNPQVDGAPEAKVNDVEMAEYADGTLVVANMTDQPYIFRDVTVAPNDAYIGKQELTVRLKPDKDMKKLLPGDSVNVTVEVVNLSDRALKNVQLDLRSVFQRVASGDFGKTILLGNIAGKGRAQRVAVVKVPSRAEDCDFNVVARLQYGLDGQGDLREAVELLRGRILKPVEVVFDLRKGKTGMELEVNLTNNSPQPLEGTLKLTPAAGLAINPTEQAVQLPSSGKQTILVNLGDLAAPSVDGSRIECELDVRGEPLAFRRRMLVALNMDLLGERNPGFEPPIYGDLTKIDWMYSGHFWRRLLCEDKDVFRGGRGSLRIDGMPNVGSLVVQSVFPPGLVFGQVRFRVWSRADGVAKPAKPEDYGLALECAGWWTAAFDPGTHDWQEKEAVCRIPKGQKVWGWIIHVMFKNCLGTAWFDDASLIADGTVLSDKTEWK